MEKTDNPILQFLQEQLIWGNTNQTLLIFIASILIGLLFKGIISRHLSHYLYKIIGKKETRIGVDKFDTLLTKPISFFVMLVIIYIGASGIDQPPPKTQKQQQQSSYITSDFKVLKSSQVLYYYYNY